MTKLEPLPAEVDVEKTPKKENKEKRARSIIYKNLTDQKSKSDF